ncbi:MAG: GH25 family lysozyme [Clostridia bacterium]
MKYYQKLFLIVFSSIQLFTSVCFADDYFDGIDISSYQGTVDFSEIPSNYNAVYIRAGGDDDFVDSKFLDNYKNAETYDLYFGFYYYVTATTVTQAENQATAFANIIENIDYSLRPAMDFENFSSLSSDEINDISLAFLSKLYDLTGVTPAIYADAYNVKTYFNADFSKYPLWVADYANLDDPSLYVLPSNDAWTSWSGYQYTDSLEISGISDKVDGDIFKSALFITKKDDTITNYTVKSGDTLWNISKTYDISIDDLVKFNNIENSNLIYVGEVLEFTNVATTYTVERGDTLTAIAKKFDTTVSSISTLNNIENINLIYVGNILKIKATPHNYNS